MAGLIVLGGCSGGSDDAEPDPERDIQDIAEPESGVPSFVTPVNGAEVGPGVAIEMDPGPIDASGETVAADAGGKFHVLVDQGCLENAEAFPPLGPDHLVFEPGETSMVAELDEGVHELCLQFGNLYDIAFYATDQITITVTP